METLSGVVGQCGKNKEFVGNWKRVSELLLGLVAVIADHRQLVCIMLYASWIFGFWRMGRSEEKLETREGAVLEMVS